MKKIITGIIMLLLFMPAAVYAGDLSPEAVCTLTGSIDRTDNTVTLTWDSVEGCDGYAVYRRSSGDEEDVRICVTSDSSFSEKVGEAQKYIYSVALVSGENEGPKSQEVSIASAVIRPARPKSLKAEGRDWNRVKVSWGKVEGASGYRLYRYSTSKKKYVLIRTLKGTSYTDSGLYPDTKYRYKVRAYRSRNGRKSYSLLTSSASARTLTSVRGLQLMRPLRNMTVGSGYGWRGGAFHIGADYAKPLGTAVYAAASGYVYRSRSNYGGLGEGIVIHHSNGVVTWYGHMNSRCVSQGSYVRKGQKIGTVGHTGNAGSNHLHYEVWVGGSHYDPECFY